MDVRGALRVAADGAGSGGAGPRGRGAGVLVRHGSRGIAIPRQITSSPNPSSCGGFREARCPAAGTRRPRGRRQQSRARVRGGLQPSAMLAWRRRKVVVMALSCRGGNFSGLGQRGLGGRDGAFGRNGFDLSRQQSPCCSDLMRTARTAAKERGARRGRRAWREGRCWPNPRPVSVVAKGRAGARGRGGRAPEMAGRGETASLPGGVKLPGAGTGGAGERLRLGAGQLAANLGAGRARPCCRNR